MIISAKYWPDNHLSVNLKASKQDGWRMIARDEREMLRLIRINQNTMRLAGVIPTWANFCSTVYWFDARKHLVDGMEQKIRAWWNLALEAYSPKDEVTHQRMAFAWMFIVFSELHLKHGRPMQRPELPPLVPEAKAKELENYILTHYSVLVSC